MSSRSLAAKLDLSSESSSSSPKPVRGKILLPKFKAITEFDKRLEEKTGFWCNANELQPITDVRNVGPDFRMLVERAYGKGGIRRVLFPAAYVGRVAKEISRAGFEVVCTDIQRMWVENARKLGMEAHLRSAEEFPEGRFDLVASFDPLLLGQNPIGFMFALRTMAETRGIVLIKWAPDRLQKPVSGPPNLSELGLDAIFNRYGCVGKMLTHDLEYTIMRVTLAPQESARLDLEMLNVMEGIERASARGLAERLGKKLEEMEGSLARIASIVNEWCNYRYLRHCSQQDAQRRRDITDLRVATGEGLNLPDDFEPTLSYRDFVQEIEITD